jgi:hypothetical protein
LFLLNARDCEQHKPVCVPKPPVNMAVVYFGGSDGRYLLMRGVSITFCGKLKKQSFFFLASAAVFNNLYIVQFHSVGTY